MVLRPRAVLGVPAGRSVLRGAGDLRPCGRDGPAGRGVVDRTRGLPDLETRLDDVPRCSTPSAPAHRAVGRRAGRRRAVRDVRRHLPRARAGSRLLERLGQGVAIPDYPWGSTPRKTRPSIGSSWRDGATRRTCEIFRQAGAPTSRGPRRGSLGRRVCGGWAPRRRHRVRRDGELHRLPRDPLQHPRPPRISVHSRHDRLRRTTSAPTGTSWPGAGPPRSSWRPPTSHPGRRTRRQP